jgi:uncharacterized iron-regulated membrane protein
MMRLLVLVHRYLGIAMCLLFAMWFASGIVMVFVPYPELSPQERFAGLQPLDLARCCVDVTAAFARSGLPEPPQQVRITMVGARPAFHFHPWDGKVSSVYADTGEPLGRVDAQLAVDVAKRFMPGQQASPATLQDYDQWSVPNSWNAYRPFHRIAMNDPAGTELYVSAHSGEVVRDTTRFERGWNWVGSVVHWIYPTVLRKHPAAWDRVVWWLALVGVVSAITGIVLGIWRFRFKKPSPGAKRSPFRRWMYWHHILGLGCMVFVLTWIVSGWLSMDHGLLFSDPAPTQAQQERFSGGSLRLAAATRNPNTLAAAASEKIKEIELVQVGGAPHYVLRYDHARSVITPANANAAAPAARLAHDTITRAAGGLLGHYAFAASETLNAYDAYYYRTDNSAPLPVLRLRFDDPAQTWFHVDPRSGALLDKMDASRRAYRWWYDALHTLDFPFFQRHVALWRTVVVSLCAIGFAFSCTGVVIGWRRLCA